MSKEIKLVSNAAVTKILHDDFEINKLITKLLSYYVNGYENFESYKKGKWDGKSTMYNWEKRMFPSGFNDMVKLALVERGYNVTHIRKQLPAPMGSMPKSLGGFTYTERYDYQWKNLQVLEKRGSYIAHMATGAGKSFASALAIYRINRPTLILTKRQPLMYQFKQNLEKFGFDCGLVGDNKFDLDKHVTIAMVQTLNARIELGDNPTEEQIKLKEETLKFLSTVEFIIGEEAHEISHNAYWNVMRFCTNAYYRIGLTATPFMKTNNENNMKLLGAFGPLGISVDEKLLIDRGILAKPIIRFTSYPKPENLRFTSNYEKAVTEGISHAEPRNKVIVDECVKAASKKLSTLILVQRKLHGNMLKMMLKKEGIRVEFIWGESGAEEREEALSKLTSGKIDVLIGSTILDVGVDVPAIGLVILAGGGKDEVAIRQRIGRGLRAKSKGPNVCFIMEFMDEHNKHLNDHSLIRKRMIKSTEGFKDCLISTFAEFPYDLF